MYEFSPFNKILLSLSYVSIIYLKLTLKQKCVKQCQ